jgi:hypothetical protein
MCRVLRHSTVLKGTLTRDFLSLVFSSNHFPWSPDTWVKAFFEDSFEFAKIFEKVDSTAVSMTPLYISQWCQWHCCACQSGVNDNAVHIAAVSMTPLGLSQLCQWHHCECYSGVCNQIHWISLWRIQSTVFMRKSYSAAHGTAVSFFANSKPYFKKVLTRISGG